MAARGIHKLTEKKIAKLNKPGRYSDGGGLYLQVEPGGTKNFIQRFSRDGRDTIIGLGKDLTAARAQAFSAPPEAADRRQHPRTAVQLSAGERLLSRL